MAPCCKKRQLDGQAGTVDRISNLPRNLIDLIVDRLPLAAAARTSTLSKTWRNIWKSLPHLVFDDVFINHLASKVEQDLLYVVSTTITNILLVHSGPILKFHLCIPQDLPLHLALAMDSWIKNISNKGVRKLEIIIFGEVTYKMPSYMFSCLELVDLVLSNSILNAPLNFGGFPHLITVVLFGVKFTADMSFGSQLRILHLRHCSGIKHLGCQFKYNNNLSSLRILMCEEIDWRWFECTKNLKHLCLSMKRSANQENNLINLDKLLCNMPRIHFLSFHGWLLKNLEPAAPFLKRLPTTVDNLKTLHFVHVDLYDMVQIQNILCIIRSSPNVQNLLLTLANEVNSENGTESSRIEQYLQLPNLFDVILDQLKTVHIHGIVGSSVDLLFIKFLLASSPSLRWMKLSSSTTINNPKDVLWISRQLLLLPRASPTSKIIFI